MEFAFSDEQQMLRETARRFLDDKAPLESVRTVMESAPGFDDGWWSAIAEQGWQAMAIPEEYGGAGFSFMEQAILMEEMGRSLFPSPYLSAIVLGADLVARLGTDGQKADLLPGAASGDTRLGLAHLEPGGGWDADGIAMEARPTEDGFVLTGTKVHVLDGHTAHTHLVVARAPGTSGTDGIGVFVVPADGPGVEAERVGTLDLTRPQATVGFDAVEVPATARLGGGAGAWDAVAATLDRAAVALAFEQVGGAQQCLEMSVAYAQERVQFGRPIGSFQAIKHKCADMLVAVESAKSAAYHAGWAVAGGGDDLAIAVPLAKSFCSEAYAMCAGENIQIHGGIGFTWEHDAHLYFKRAKTDELLFGTPAEHRARLADALGF
jgi:alkylation response protein AidB-like acyl-CoA dehydrogenase